MMFRAAARGPAASSATSTPPAAHQHAHRNAKRTSEQAARIPTAPAATRTVTVPEGTDISIRLVDAIDTERNQVGDGFRATLAQPVYVGDEVVMSMGADVEGRIVDVKSASHYTGQLALTLELVRVSVNGQSYQLRTNQVRRQGTPCGKRTAGTVGDAGLGAIIGGIAGGGKGATTGAAVGTGIKLPSETVLKFTLDAPLNITLSAPRNGRSGD